MEQINIINPLNKNIKFKKVLSFLVAFMLLIATFSIEGLNVFAISVKKTSISSVNATSASAITIKWKKISSVSGYIVYQKKADGSYKKIATINGASKISYTNKKLTSATKYSYRVKTYKTKNGKTYYGSLSAVKSAYTLPGSMRLYEVKPISKTSLSLKWEKVPRATGYVVYKKTGSKYTKIATVKQSSKPSYTVKKLTSGTKYSFYVKAYLKVNNKTLYGAKSNNLSARTFKTYGAASLSELKTALSSNYLFTQKQTDYMNFPMFYWAYNESCHQATTSSPEYRDTVEVYNQWRQIIKDFDYTKFKIQIGTLYKCNLDLYSSDYIKEMLSLDSNLKNTINSEKKKLEGIWTASYTLVSDDGMKIKHYHTTPKNTFEDQLFIYKIDGRYYWSYVGIYL